MRPQHDGWDNELDHIEDFLNDKHWLERKIAELYAQVDHVDQGKATLIYDWIDDLEYERDQLIGKR